ncbi:unnamed protein product [Caenorhabditis angaria]|uniref:Uncharacterized protein n=1 Tax=Caenorhabditis angaria TaxID=860376 RepID=A0A9P1J4G4_9PELO|nr:unnamed protein product [Caenorhabditis angaria]
MPPDTSAERVTKLYLRSRSVEFNWIFTRPNVLKTIFDSWPTDIEKLYTIAEKAYEGLFSENPTISNEYHKCSKDDQSFIIRRVALSLQQAFHNAITFFYERQHASISTSIEKFASDMQSFGEKFRYFMPVSYVINLQSLLKYLAYAYIDHCVEMKMRPRDKSVPPTPEEMTKFNNDLHDTLSEIIRIMRVNIAYGYEYKLYEPSDEEIRILGENRHKKVTAEQSVSPGSFIELANQRCFNRSESRHLERHHSEPIQIADINFDLLLIS